MAFSAANLSRAKKRGLAATGGTDDEQHLAKVSDKPDTIHGNHLGLALAKPFCQISCDDRLIIYWSYAVTAHFVVPGILDCTST